jgi:hypothetical protein
MSATASIQDRIARTRRQQTRALDGAGQEPARPAPAEARLPSRGPAANEPAATRGAVAAQARTPEFGDLTNEMAALLPVAKKLYGYGAADVQFIADSVSASRAGALEELRAIVRQWRIDAVTHGLDSAQADGAPLMPRGVAERARTQFRMDVMGKTEDEGGMKYAATVLDWRPEGSEWVIPAPAVAARPTAESAPPAPPAPAQAPPKRRKP